MRNIQRIFLYLMLVLASLNVHAGGPADGSTITKVGSLQLINYANVFLFSQEVRVKLVGDYTQVKSQFDLLNNQEQEAVAEFGIPVDFAENFEQEFLWKEEYMKDFVLMVDGKKHDFVQSLEVKPHIDSISGADGKKTAVRLMRKWYKLTLTFPPLQNHTINLEYKIKNRFEDWEYSRSFLPEYSSRVFQYDFGPSMGMGSGADKNITPNITLMIDCSEVSQDLVNILGYLGGYMSKEKGLNGEKDLGTYVVNKTDVKLTKFSGFRIEYQLNIQKLGKSIYNNLVPDDKILSRKFSSESFAYPFDYLMDVNYNTAWAEGTEHQGVGEWLEFKFDDYPVGAIVIINGYVKNEATYYNNGRVSKVKVEREYLDATNRIKTDDFVISLPDRPYKEVEESNYAQCIDILKDFGVNTPRVRRIRITILEARPGKRGDETCITELFFVGREQKVNNR